VAELEDTVEAVLMDESGREEELRQAQQAL
jgi:hypothetical protein